MGWGTNTPYESFLEFALPTLYWSGLGGTWDKTGCRTECSWFGFKIAIRPGSPVTRTDLASELDRNQIGNRMLFGGNLLRQPAFVQLRNDNPNSLRVIGSMDGADEIMNNTLFLGTYPGMTEAMLDEHVKISNFIDQ